ncbi:hypothetical protein GGI12_001068 [Dipsacomyces acuminosporus]|nr:hypothetical protein GGI12_001068 [Dipsacomyces acuminosporus]
MMVAKPARPTRHCRNLSRASSASSPAPSSENGKNRKPKTSWTAAENRAIFRTLAEYIYVDEEGLRPLTIYPSSDELELIEEWEEQEMSNDEIAIALYENSQANNPNRRPDLLFLALRQLQTVSGDHTTREVSEKLKNVRGRFVNWFITIHEDGSYPTLYAARYLSALLNNYVSSPFFPAHLIPRSHYTDAVEAAKSATDDISLWIQSMFWLYPENMFKFMHHCAIQVVRADIMAIPSNLRTPEENALFEAPQVDQVVKHLRRIIERHAPSSGAKGSGKGKKDLQSRPQTIVDALKNSDSKPSMRKRKRGSSLSSTKNPKMARVARKEFICPTSAIPVSVDGLHTGDKMDLVGLRVKFVAAVGGVIRRGLQKSKLDSNYHLYRLFASVSRFSDITPLFIPAIMNEYGRPMHPQFEELVIVRHFVGDFEETNVEPRIRVSRERFPCAGQCLESLITSQVFQVANDSRDELPVWLAISKRSDNKYVLALVVSAAHPSKSSSSTPSYIKYRTYRDEELNVSIHTAIHSNGQNTLGGLPIRYHDGLNFWPLDGSKDKTIALDNKRKELVSSISGNTYTYVAACTYTLSKLDKPWWEPRILSDVAYISQLQFAKTSILSAAPTFAQLSKNEVWTPPVLPAESEGLMLSNDVSPALVDGGYSIPQDNAPPATSWSSPGADPFEWYQPFDQAGVADIMNGTTVPQGFPDDYAEGLLSALDCANLQWFANVQAPSDPTKLLSD